LPNERDLNYKAQQGQGDEAMAATVANQARIQEDIRQQVREGYARIATESGENRQKSTGCCAPAAPKSAGGAAGGCCGGSTIDSASLVHSIGYGESDLAAVPDSANMGLSCGNPTAIASLKPGEVVLDLGSGGGFDAFVAGPKVGTSGRVIGVDMTAEMIAKARRNIESYRMQSGLNNVEFRLGEIEHLPVADNSVDVVISNCVLNLSPDKPQVWREIARVLKPGGRVAVSDLALLRPLPENILRMMEALVGCVAGAVMIDEIRQAARNAGLLDITLTPKGDYIDAMTQWQDPLYVKIVESLPAGTKPSDYITSVDVTARKQRT
jgi:arsenite methyltransferase